MRPLRYSINVTLDGCCDHQAVSPDDEIHSYWARNLEQADALLFGRITYQMMEEAWRRPSNDIWPDWMNESEVEFAETIDSKKKHVVSRTLDWVDWNSELIGGDLEIAIRELKAQPGGLISVGGLTLPLALADLGLIDQYEFVVHPVIAGHGPTLFAGLREKLDLELTGRDQFGSGALLLRYEPKLSASAG